MIKTYYTSNITNESYTSINLVCNAIDKYQAFVKFKKYIKEQYLNDNHVSININQIKKLNKEVKEFYCSG